MRYFVFVIFAIISTTKGYCQMNKKSFYDIDLYVLNKREKDSILSKIDFSEREEKGNDIYELKDGRVLYEIAGVKVYLFSGISDFNYFKQKCIEIANESVKSKTLIKDSNFIEKTDLYIDFFKNAFNLKFDLSDLDSLKKIDNLLNTLKKEDLLKYKLSIIAIIGQAIILNSDSANGKWKNVQLSKENIIPMVFVKGAVIEPIKIYDEQIYEKYEKGKKITIYASVKEYVESL